MGRKDPDARREYNRQYSAANPRNSRECDKQYRAENAERISKQKKQYCAANAEKIREHKRQYQAENAEKMREYKKRYQAENAEKIREHKRQYRAENLEKKKEYTRQYRAKKYDQHFFCVPRRCKTTPIKLLGLWHKQRGLCALSGRKLTRKNAHLDHILPRARGGADTVDNLQWLCKEANEAKRALTDDEFITLCREVIAHQDSKAACNENVVNIEIEA